MPRAGPALCVLAAALLAGCTGAVVPARVPDALLQGDGGNGWAADAAHTDAQPRSENLGLVQRQTLGYADDGRGGNGGYPATLTLTTLKMSPAPGEPQLRDILRDQVRRGSEESGIRLGDQVVEGGRALGDGHRTLFFVFTGNVTGGGPLFTTRDATAKILGEVWNCPEASTSVAAVGLAQVSSVQSVGGIPLPAQEDPRNWRELAGDPSGGVDGQRDLNGLLFHARCA
jgi:hypothetical protein